MFALLQTLIDFPSAPAKTYKLGITTKIRNDVQYHVCLCCAALQSFIIVISSAFGSSINDLLGCVGFLEPFGSRRSALLTILLDSFIRLQYDLCQVITAEIVAADTDCRCLGTFSVEFIWWRYSEVIINGRNHF